LKVLVVGSGGREHALVWKIKQSPKVREIFCWPGNAGIAEHATCLPGSPEDVEGIVKFIEQEKIDLTVVGPELPLMAGLTDEIVKRGFKVFGPSKLAAEIEGSKVFAKNLFRKYGIPTAKFNTFASAQEAKEYIKELNSPCVVKADGLAAGKGVIIAQNTEEALRAVDLIMEDKTFGSAGNQVVVEEMLVGEEVSLLVFTDGKTVVPMVSAQDHKRIFDHDQGPNTGGMGAYAPAPVLTPELQDRVVNEIIIPTVKAMEKEGRPYKGVLYAGLMVTDRGPQVLEYNARFGDPETQAILPLLESDLVEIMEAVIEERLDRLQIKWKSGHSVCVVAASGGYPGKYEQGKEIFGLEEAEKVDNLTIFHAGTSKRDGKIVTAGGRVLGVTAWADDLVEAIDKAYQGISKINFEGMHYRKDIASKALARYK
jgi:phosphoribosylamine--glycine ligase